MTAGVVKLPAEKLQRVLGIIDVNYLVSDGSLAIVDSPLGVRGLRPQETEVALAVVELITWLDRQGFGRNKENQASNQTKKETKQ